MPLLIALTYLGLALAGVWGWCLNLVAAVHLILANSPLTGIFIGRVAGIFLPILGAVLGYF